MVKALKLGVCTPALYAVDEVQRSITMQEVQGVSVKDFLLSQAADGPGKLFLTVTCSCRILSWQLVFVFPLRVPGVPHPFK